MRSTSPLLPAEVSRLSGLPTGSGMGRTLPPARPAPTGGSPRWRGAFAAGFTGGLAFAFVSSPAQAAQSVPIVVEAGLRHDDNLGRANRAKDKRDDTALQLGVSADQSRVLGRDWLLAAGLAAKGEHWLAYDAFDTADFEARLSMRRRFGFGSAAPALRLRLAGGPRIAAEQDRSGWTGRAGLEFSHRPHPLVRYTLAAEVERHDARDTFYDVTARTFSADLAFFPAESWTVATGLHHRFGDVLSFASPPPTWRQLSPYLRSVPVRRATDFFDDPLNAYTLEATTVEGTVSLSCALDETTTLTLGFAYADTRRDGLRYLNRVTTLGIVRRF